MHKYTESEENVSPSLSFESSTIDFSSQAQPSPLEVKSVSKKLDPLLTKFKHARAKFVELSQLSTLHGYSNMFRARKRLVKVMWFVVFLAFVGATATFLTSNILEYAKYEVNSRIRLVSEFEAVFPGLAICNSYMFTGDQNSNYVIKYFRQVNPSVRNRSTLLEFVNSLSLKSLYNELYTLKQYAFNETVEVKQTFGLNVSQLIIYCKLYNEKCDLEKLEWIWDAHFGNCFRLNSGFNREGKVVPVEKVYETGAEQGLTLNLFDRLEDNDFIQISNIEKSFGPSVVIYNQTQFQFPNSFDSIKLRAGTCTNVRIGKVITSVMPKPYSNCHDPNSYNSDLLREMKRQGKFLYTQEHCVALCKNEYIIKECDCFSPFLPNIRQTVRACFTRDEYNCSYEVFKDVTRKVRPACFDQCPIECQSTRYNFFVSYDDWPSVGYFEQLKKNAILIERFALANKTLNYENVKASMSCLNVYFDELTYTDISETASMTLIDLVSNIGGTIGLFLGVSLMSVIEIFELILEMTYIFFGKF